MESETLALATGMPIISTTISEHFSLQLRSVGILLHTHWSFLGGCEFCKKLEST